MAVGTSLAFIVAAVSYLRDVGLKKEAQARLVYSKLVDLSFHEAGEPLAALQPGVTMGILAVQATRTYAGGTACIVPSTPVVRVTASIRNRSDELIGPAKLQIVNTGRKVIFESFAGSVGSVDPQSDMLIDFVFPNTEHPNQPSIGTTVIFRDASGAWWRRHLAEPIESVHDDPENSAPTPTERAQYAENARAMGITPRPPLAIPLRVKYRRAIRARRGKSAIP